MNSKNCDQPLCKNCEHPLKFVYNHYEHFSSEYYRPGYPYGTAKCYIPGCKCMNPE